MAKYRRIREVVGAMAEIEAAMSSLDVDAKKIEDKIRRLQSELEANREQRRRLDLGLAAITQSEVKE